MYLDFHKHSIKNFCIYLWYKCVEYRIYLKVYYLNKETQSITFILNFILIMKNDLVSMFIYFKYAYCLASLMLPNLPPVPRVTAVFNFQGWSNPYLIPVSTTFRNWSSLYIHRNWMARWYQEGGTWQRSLLVCYVVMETHQGVARSPVPLPTQAPFRSECPQKIKFLCVD